jgi:hypothetical protein
VESAAGAHDERAPLRTSTGEILPPLYTRHEAGEGEVLKPADAGAGQAPNAVGSRIRFDSQGYRHSFERRLLIVSDELTLEQIYAAITPAERELARRINPTLYTTEEFLRRRKVGDSFVTKVLTGEHIVLARDEHGIAATR